MNVEGSPLSPVVAVVMDRVFVSRPDRGEVIEVGFDGKIAQRWHGRPTPFKSPRGLAVTRRHMYVADVGANRIYRLDRLQNHMDVVAGNGKGEPAREFLWRTPKACPLAQPMGLAREGNTLLMSLGGARQIWALEIEYNALGRAAGTGNPGFVDGEFLFANFQRPTDLAVAWKGERVYIADAGKLRCLDFTMKAIRTVPLPDDAPLTGLAADRDRYLFTVQQGSREVKVWDTHGERTVGRFVLPWNMETASLAWSKEELWALAETGEVMARKRPNTDLFEVVALTR